MSVTHPGGVQDLTPLWAGEGFPADVRTALQTTTDVATHSTPVVVARRVSPGARALLSESGVSWADEAGALELTAGTIFIRTPGNPSDARMTPPQRFTAAAGAMAEILLQRAAEGDQRVPTVAELADAVGASRGAASRALTFFDMQGWTSNLGPQRGPTARRELTERGAMLDAWGAWHAAGDDTVVHAHAVIRDADVWLSDVVARHWPAGAWAATGLVGLERRAPFATTTNPIDVYLDATAYDDDLDALLQVAGLTRTDSGIRVRILRGDRYVLRQASTTSTDSPYPLVSDVRLYGDLLRRGGVRADEFAMHLREIRIGF
ncbi:hypothetical protein [Cellulomonas sp. S1-8]|uniref:hypothetical protein n=1 Tax=Cellulomonas sp. S1-8 TaxID=2904790 RepID=UPI0022438CB0|nr:hypothetical protein [Cellulomonas sp. S1-8]UZN03035.1 hypothetical protein OKX07_18595 [Cellulomonas sp. S1-8]